MILMGRLLSTEWLKLRKYRTFWIMLGMFSVLLPLWNYGINSGKLQIFGNSGIDIIDKAYNFQNVWANLGWWTSIFVIFITILTIIITTNEYSFKTARQNVIDGYTRMQFYHAKWAVVFALAIFTTLFVFILGVIFGAVNDSFNNFPGKLDKLFYVFVLSMNYYGFGLLLGILLKRSGLGIAMFFLYSMIIESLLSSFLLLNDMGKYLPLQSSDVLLPFPIVDFLKEMAQMKTEPSSTSFVIASFAWIIVYYIIGRIRLVKSDW